IVLCTAHIRMRVDDDAHELLAHSLAHETRLAGVNLEPLVEGNATHGHPKTAGGPFQSLVAGKRQVVGGAGVTGPQRLRGRPQAGGGADRRRGLPAPAMWERPEAGAANDSADAPARMAGPLPLRETCATRPPERRWYTVPSTAGPRPPDSRPRRTLGE